MRTRFGERRRPHFNIVDWVHMDVGGESPQTALPAPLPDSSATRVIEAEAVMEPVVAAGQAAGLTKPAKRPKSNSLNRVAPLTTAEEMNDELPW